MRFWEVSWVANGGLHVHNNYAIEDEAKAACELRKDCQATMRECNNSSDIMVANTADPYVRWVGFVHLGPNRTCRGECQGVYLCTHDDVEAGKAAYKKRMAEEEKAIDQYYSRPWV